jgi:diguanylate cyclase
MTDQTFQDLHWLLDIIQSTDIGIIVLDRNFMVEVYNRFMQVHSNIGPEEMIGAKVFDKFPYLDGDWFKRRVESVFDLGIPVYTTWEQRDYVFEFPLKLPIHHETGMMYQNTTFIPLRSSNDTVEKVGIVVYDVTDSAINKTKLEVAKDELLVLSRTDKLTTLWNRGYWEERLNAEYQRYKRTSSPASMVIFDIDFFKKVNDTYGHQVGDDVIRSVSNILLESSREVDICGRYGGEEFVVILPDTSVEGAMNYCERLRKRAETNAVSSGGRTVSYTVSLGIALLEDSIKNPSEWIVRADIALYKAKDGGRNRSCYFTAGDA